jgi:hypothetical protein
MAMPSLQATPGPNHLTPGCFLYLLVQQFNAIHQNQQDLIFVKVPPNNLVRKEARNELEVGCWNVSHRRHLPFGP